MDHKDLFHAAIRDLAAINDCLGLDPDDGGAEPIISAIEELKANCADRDDEIKRLRDGLSLITSEPINAEYMAQNILDGLPPYHDTMIKADDTATLRQKIRSAQIAAGEDAVIANLRSMGLTPNAM